MLTSLKPGHVRVLLPGGQEEIFYISGGLLEVQPHLVTILADTALRADDIDEAAALEAKQLAEQAMTERHTDFDYSKAATALAEALAQVEAVQSWRKKMK
jgi:F-type H+-transporting ATPase subunit epsilon